MTSYGNYGVSQPGAGITEVAPSVIRTASGPFRTDLSSSSPSDIDSSSAPALCVDVAAQPGERQYEAVWRLRRDPASGIAYNDQIRWLAQILNDSRGWGRANIQFRYTEDPGAPAIGFVPFAHMQDICGVDTVSGCSVSGDFSVISSGRFGPGPGNDFIGTINHEAGHLFFGANHTGSGVMTNTSSTGVNFPDDGDISSLKSWMGT